MAVIIKWSEQSKANEITAVAGEWLRRIRRDKNFETVIAATTAEKRTNYILCHNSMEIRRTIIAAFITPVWNTATMGYNSNITDK